MQSMIKRICQVKVDFIALVKNYMKIHSILLLSSIVLKNTLRQPGQKNYPSIFHPIFCVVHAFYTTEDHTVKIVYVISEKTGEKTFTI